MPPLLRAHGNGDRGELVLAQAGGRLAAVRQELERTPFGGPPGTPGSGVAVALAFVYSALAIAVIAWRLRRVLGQSPLLATVLVGVACATPSWGCFCTSVGGSPAGTEGLDLLYELTDRATQPQFVYTHRWQLHDVVFWDNTWDANGDGDRTNDPRTHAGIVLAVDDDRLIRLNLSLLLGREGLEVDTAATCRETRVEAFFADDDFALEHGENAQLAHDADVVLRVDEVVVERAAVNFAVAAGVGVRGLVEPGRRGWCAGGSIFLRAGGIAVPSV